MTSKPHASVLVLGGGPDAEREVSLQSASQVAAALSKLPRFRVVHKTIHTITQAELKAAGCDVVFPALHGLWGEGGQLQDLLAASGLRYVGCKSEAARLAMDKILTKVRAIKLGVPVPRAAILNPRDPVCPIDFPVVVKPVHEGSSVGLFLVHTPDDWARARDAAAKDTLATGRAYMIERFVQGREITVGILAPGRPDCTVLPTIEIQPKSGLYDYDAKYNRQDTVYKVNPSLPPGVDATIRSAATRLATALEMRHLCRIDFRLDHINAPWLLEINTMPGFTSHSLVPMAAAKAGLDFPALCERLVDMALAE